VCGSEDGFCALHDVKEWAKAIPGAEVRVLEGEDHLFSRSPSGLAGIVAAFVTGS
jgi:hypothetical protein